MSLTFLEEMAGQIDRGGVVLWIIAALSVATLAVILWKLLRLFLLGAWSRGRSETALAAWAAGDAEAGLALGRRGGIRGRVFAAAMAARRDPALDPAAAREETMRIARHEMARARAGLRALELVSTIAPLLGLLGTVIGMIAAFQALQAAGARADPAVLAGGIWEALITTAAGMAVAIPAGVALAWFDSLCDRIQQDLEDGATRVFTRGPAHLAPGGAAR